MTRTEEVMVENLLEKTRAHMGDVITQQQGSMVHGLVLTLMNHADALGPVMNAMVAAQARVKEELLTAVATHQRAQLTQLLHDVRSEQPSVVSQLISACFQNQYGLVDWVRDPQYKRSASDLVEKFHFCLVAERGNDCRSLFEQLLGVYMTSLGMTKYPEELSQRIAEFKHYLLPPNNTLDRNATTVRHQLIWGCHGIRNIGNSKSHTATKLTPDEQIEICAAVSALARTLPIVAAEMMGVSSSDGHFGSISTSLQCQQPQSLLQSQSQSQPQLQSLMQSSMSQSSSMPSNFSAFLQSALPSMAMTSAPPPGLGDVSWSPSPMLMSLRANQPPLPSTAAPPLPPPLPPMPSVDQRASFTGGFPVLPASSSSRVPSSPWSQSSTNSSSSSSSSPTTGQDATSPVTSQLKRLEIDSSSSAAATTTTTTTTTSSLSVDASATGGGAITSQSSTSTVVFADPRRVYQMYYSRPDSLPPWSDAKTKMLYARMRNHMQQVSKANLCHYQHCHVPNCQKSHSYLECMSYNPIFKLLKCGNKDHYWGFEVDEVAECACAHVDLEIAKDWMTSAKFQLCIHGARCSIRRCLKSHTLQEIKFYNPRFRTDQCQYQSRCVNKATCPYYHTNEDKRDVRQEDDYVGVPDKILFIERTHDSIAKALDALRRQHSHA